MSVDFCKVKTIKKSLSELAHGASMPWPKLSCLLDAIDSTQYWGKEAHSFTDWLKQNAIKIGLKESTLWRYLVVGRYYRDLREQFSRVKLDYPPLEELPDHVSPEKLELLSKLARVAPKDFFEPAMCLVLENKISRDELRAKWQAFRPALQGRTARGRGTIAPHINLKNKDQYHSVLEAMIINALRASGSSWLGASNARKYEVKMHVMPDNPSSDQGKARYVFDAVVLAKLDNQSQVDVHGIKIGHTFTLRSEKLIDMASYCDFFWVAFHDEYKRFSKLHIPDSIGVLKVNDGDIEVIQPANPCDKDFEHASAMLKGLLTRESRN